MLPLQVDEQIAYYIRCAPEVLQKVLFDSAYWSGLCKVFGWSTVEDMPRRIGDIVAHEFKRTLVENGVERGSHFCTVELINNDKSKDVRKETLDIFARLCHVKHLINFLTFFDAKKKTKWTFALDVNGNHLVENGHSVVLDVPK